MLSEFKTFVRRGNVVDLAVGVVIGASFGSIVTSLVNDVLMPPIGLLLGRVDFSHLSVSLTVPGRQAGEPPVPEARGGGDYEGVCLLRHDDSNQGPALPALHVRAGGGLGARGRRAGDRAARPGLGRSAFPAVGTGYHKILISQT